MTTLHKRLSHSVLLILAMVAVSGCNRDRNDEAAARDSQPAADAVPPPAIAPATTDTDADVDVNADLTADDPDRTPGQTIDDSVITGKVKTALLADDQVKGLQIDVDTMEGVVTLTGSASTQTQVNRALEIATGTEGVRSVNNQITVGAGG